MVETKIDDIKDRDIIQVFNYERLSLELYEVYDIYISEYGGKIFECFKLGFNDKKELKQSDFTGFIHSKDVMGIYKEIK